MRSFFFSTEYDPNPLLSLSKRKRRASTSVSTEERRVTQTILSPVQTIPEIPKIKDDVEKENKDINKQDTDAHRERKRLKKRKRDKLKVKIQHDDKKKKKKHKCTDENCKHKRHHKKHRKHKKHHHAKNEETEIIVSKELEEIKPTVAEEEDEQEQSTVDHDEFPEYQVIINAEDEVTLDDILESKSKVVKNKSPFFKMSHLLFLL